MTNPVLSAPLDLITTSILTLLRDDSPEKGAGWVYDGAYDGDPVKPIHPHHILYCIPGGSSDRFPDLADSRRGITAVWQLTTVGKYRNQCQRAAQAAHDRFVGRTRDPGGPWRYAHPLTMPTGWRCTDRRPDPAMPGVDRSGDTPNAIYSLPARFYLTISPA